MYINILYYANVFIKNLRKYVIVSNENLRKYVIVDIRKSLTKTYCILKSL